MKNIIKEDIVELLERSMGNYSFNTNLFRAFPDIRDGLKPDSRRIIYSMRDMNLVPSKPHKKVADRRKEFMKEYEIDVEDLDG